MHHYIVTYLRNHGYQWKCKTFNFFSVGVDVAVHRINVFIVAVGTQLFVLFALLLSCKMFCIAVNHNQHQIL